ncbi:MAG TPA: hypothetical protein VMF58_18360 [Rhizomicrobium sp.]|nr:hypothetical protein [Rhizomicrobium sp.]
MLFRRSKIALRNDEMRPASEEDAEIIPFPEDHSHIVDAAPETEIESPTADAQADARGRIEIGPDIFESALERYASEGAHAAGLQDCVDFRPDGLHFTKARFDFEIPLASRRLDFALHFDNCVFHRPIDARWAKLDSLALHRCVLEKEFRGAALDARGNIDFVDTRSESQIDLSDARLKGDLILNRACLKYSDPEHAWWSPSDVRDGAALFCGGMHAHSVFMIRTESEGRIFLDSVRLAGIFKAANATLRLFKRVDDDGVLERDKPKGKIERWDHMALTMADAEVHGGVILGEEAWGTPEVPDTFKAVGQVNLSNSQIGGDLVCTNGEFLSAYHDADPEKGVFDSFLDKDQPVHNALLVSLNVSRTQIGGGVWLERDFHACGEVRFDASSVRGTFRCTGATFDGALPGCETATKDTSKRYYARVAMVLDRIEIGSALMLNNGFIAFGRVSLRNAIIHGDLNCEGGTFHACWHRRHEGELYDDPERQPEALALSGAEISGSVFLTRAANGSDKTDGQKIVRPLVREQGEHVRMTFRSYGQIRLRGTRIGRNLHLCGGQFDSVPEASERADNAPKDPKKVKPPKPAAEKLIGWFHSARVEGTTFLVEPDRDPVRFRGSVTFAGMDTGGWEDSIDCWPRCATNGHGAKQATVELNGLTYKTLHGPMRGEERLMWLLHQPENDLRGPPRRPSLLSSIIAIFKSPDPDEREGPKVGFKTQPWEQCARVLYELGYHRDARFLYRMEQRFLRLKSSQNWSDRFLSFILGTFVGHGYRVFYALLWAVGLFVMGGIVGDAGYRSGYIAPAQPEIVTDWLHRQSSPGAPSGAGGYSLPPEYPRFHPLLYSIDIALPAGNLRQMDYWIPSDKRVLEIPKLNDQASLPEATNPWLVCILDLMGPCGKLTVADKVEAAPAAIEVSLGLAALVTIALGLRWILPWALMYFPGNVIFAFDGRFSQVKAWGIYRRVLNERRKLWRILIPPFLVVCTLYFFFFVLILYLFDAQPIYEVVHQLNDYCSIHIGMSFSHIWSAFETLMGWLLITSVGIGLGAVVFRRTES